MKIFPNCPPIIASCPVYQKLSHWSCGQHCKKVQCKCHTLSFFNCIFIFICICTWYLYLYLYFYLYLYLVQTVCATQCTKKHTAAVKLYHFLWKVSALCQSLQEHFNQSVGGAHFTDGPDSETEEQAEFASVLFWLCSYLAITGNNRQRERDTTSPLPNLHPPLS